MLFVPTRNNADAIGGQKNLPTLHLTAFAIIKTCLLADTFCYVTLSTRRYSWRDLLFHGAHLSPPRPILCDAPVRAALRDAVKTVQSRHPFTVDAWVLLPDHLHSVPAGVWAVLPTLNNVFIIDAIFLHSRQNEVS